MERTTRRPRRTKAQIEQLERQILDVLEEDNPQSVRHVFYRLTNPRLPEPVEKTEAGYKQIQARLALMRKAGRVPYGWISDATRRGHHVSTFTCAGELITQFAAYYRADLWRSARTLVEVWCESRSIAGVLEADCEALAVSLYPCAGFASLSLTFEAAESINRRFKERAFDRVVVVYIGDHDPAGHIIDASARKALREHLDPEIELTFRRIAVNHDQIEILSLPTKPRKATDRRRLDIQETVEAEALPAVELRRMLRETIEEYIPLGTLEATKIAEESERRGLYMLGAYAASFGTAEAVTGMQRGVLLPDAEDLSGVLPDAEDLSV